MKLEDYELVYEPEVIDGKTYFKQPTWKPIKRNHKNWIVITIFAVLLVIILTLLLTAYINQSMEKQIKALEQNKEDLTNSINKLESLILYTNDPLIMQEIGVLKKANEDLTNQLNGLIDNMKSNIIKKSVYNYNTYY